MTVFSRPHLALLACAALACGGGGSSGGGSGFTATVNGRPFAAEPVGVTARGGGVPGGIVITGAQTAGNLVTSLSLSLHAITGPGTYALGVGVDIYGGSASVGESPPGTGGNTNHWATALDGLAGEIVITTLTPTRIVATFHYTAVADEKTPGATGNRTVTDGKVDLPLTGVLVPVPENVGSKLSAVLGGKPYNAYSLDGLLMDFMGGAGVAVDSHNSDHGLSLMLVGVTAPGSYDLSSANPLRRITAGKNGGDASHCCWGGNAPGDTGNITITSLTPQRVKGTFSGTLQAQPGKPATAPLTITGGTFDIGIR
jgi:hypothetical protein